MSAMWAAGPPKPMTPSFTKRSATSRRDAAGLTRPRVHRWLRGPVLDARPVGSEDPGRDEVDAHRDVAALAREDQRLRLRRHAGHADGRMRPLVRSQMEPETDVRLRLGDAEAPVLGLVEARLRVVPELEDQIQDGPRDPALLATLRVKAAHLEVAGEPAGAHAPVVAASGHLVELGDALCEHEGVVIRQTGHPGAELYRLRRGKRAV